ncbi:MAG: DUF2846 domain-containing protein [Methylophaga sp.]|nr:DUF2846 domain-containing protein [Methylophaga sp.]
MKKLLLMTVVSTVFLSGCASVPMESSTQTESAKEFKLPDDETAGVYVYRNDSHFGAALKKSVWMDGDCVGETAKGVFFYQEVEGNKEHTISTESEFSPNDLILYLESGKLYFIQQFIKFGAFVGGAGLEQKNTAEGKQEVSKLNLAKKGTCGTATASK